MKLLKLNLISYINCTTSKKAYYNLTKPLIVLKLNLKNEFSWKEDSSVPIEANHSKLLSAPRVRTTFASRGFSVAAPAVWNSLPSGIHDASSTHTFRRLLKTHCFQQAFGSP